MTRSRVLHLYVLCVWVLRWAMSRNIKSHWVFETGLVVGIPCASHQHAEPQNPLHCRSIRSLSRSANWQLKLRRSGTIHRWVRTKHDAKTNKRAIVTIYLIVDMCIRNYNIAPRYYYLPICPCKRCSYWIFITEFFFCFFFFSLLSQSQVSKWLSLVQEMINYIVDCIIIKLSTVKWARGCEVFQILFVRNATAPHTNRTFSLAIRANV